MASKTSAKVEQPAAAQPEASKSKLNVMKVESPTPEKKEAANATVDKAPPQEQKAQIVK